MIIGTGSHGRLQPSWYLLEKQCSRHTQLRRLLRCVGDKVLMQAVEEPVRRGVLLVLVLTDKEGLVGTVGCSSHEIMEFRILMEESRIATLDFRRDKPDLFKDLHGGISWH